MELDPSLYTVAWITSQEIEARAAALMLDHSHAGRFPIQRGNDLVYQAGEICGHNVIIMQLPASHNPGMRSASRFTDEIQRIFPKVWFGLVVGLATGLPKLTGPSPRDIRLGDVLVGLPDRDSANDGPVVDTLTMASSTKTQGPLPRKPSTRSLENFVEGETGTQHLA